MKLQIFRIISRSYNKTCEWKYCFILSEWYTIFLLIGVVWVSYVDKRSVSNLGFQGYRFGLKLN